MQCFVFILSILPSCGAIYVPGHIYANFFTFSSLIGQSYWDIYLDNIQLIIVFIYFIFQLYPFHYVPSYTERADNAT